MAKQVWLVVRQGSKTGFIRARSGGETVGLTTKEEGKLVGDTGWMSASVMLS